MVKDVGSKHVGSEKLEPIWCSERKSLGFSFTANRTQGPQPLPRLKGFNLVDVRVSILLRVPAHNDHLIVTPWLHFFCCETQPADAEEVVRGAAED